MQKELKLLLIEDDEDDYILLKTMLSDYSPGTRLELVTSYEEGHRAILDCRHDLVLLDYRLGERTGLELLQDVSDAGCEVPIIILTGQGRYEIDVEAMRAGAADYLVKGQITPDLLERSIRYAIERKQAEAELRRYRDHLKQVVEDLEERTKELARANEALRVDEMRLEVLVELSQMRDVSLKQVSDFVVEQQVRLTGSEVGWLGFVNADEDSFVIHAGSMSARHHCEELPACYAVEEAGIWTDTIRRGAPIIANGADVPEPIEVCPHNRQHLTRFMSVPVLEGEKVVGVALVGNKETDYDQSDVRQLTLLMDGIWRLVQRERSHEALHESENLAAMGRALSSVAHEMRIPLVAIGGFSSMVFKHLAEKDPNRRKLEIIVKETRRLECMVREMLDFSRPLELDRTEDDINRLIEDSLLIVESSARERNIGIQTEVDADLPHVSIDSMRMKQVIINLALNAIQASPAGETIRLRARLRRGNLLIDVTDCGCGIPLPKRQEIFAPFVSSKKEGTGLGLPIVKKIVDAHGGRVQVLDNSGGGITFRVIIPCNESGSSCIWGGGNATER